MTKHLEYPMHEIGTYQELKEFFIPPTFSEYLHYMFIATLPSFHRCVILEQAYGGPMSEQDEREFFDVLHQRKEDLPSEARMRARTALGWYLSDWVDYFRKFVTVSPELYTRMVFDDLYDVWLDINQHHL